MVIVCRDSDCLSKSPRRRSELRTLALIWIGDYHIIVAFLIKIHPSMPRRKSVSTPVVPETDRWEWPCRESLQEQISQLQRLRDLVEQMEQGLRDSVVVKSNTPPVEVEQCPDVIENLSDIVPPMDSEVGNVLDDEDSSDLEDSELMDAILNELRRRDY